MALFSIVWSMLAPVSGPAPEVERAFGSCAWLVELGGEMSSLGAFLLLCWSSLQGYLHARGNIWLTALSSSLCLFPAMLWELQRWLRYLSYSRESLAWLRSSQIRVWRQQKGLGLDCRGQGISVKCCSFPQPHLDGVSLLLSTAVLMAMFPHLGFRGLH